jgi:formylmethanofuran dehydrogenase subunit E
MSNKNDNTTFCDDCGEPTTEERLVVYTRLPFAVASANIGESAVICLECDESH